MEISSLDEQLNILKSIDKLNLQTYCELENLIKKSPDLQVKYPIKGKCDKIVHHYLNAKRRCSDTFNRLNSEYDSLVEQERKYQLEIDQMQQNSEKIKLQLKESQENHEITKKNFEIHKYTYNLAKDIYYAKFKVHIDIEDVEADYNDVFVAMVYFNTKNKKCPVKFTINRAQNKIIDFDASSVLLESEVKGQKMKFEESGNVLALACALRKVMEKPQ